MLLQETPRTAGCRASSFKVPTRCPARTGASRGWTLSSVAFSLSLAALGERQAESRGEARVQRLAVPFHTLIVVTGWLAEYRRTPS
jgi:hypothetical protein